MNEEKYEQSMAGMTSDEVKSLVGEEGTLYSEEGEKGTDSHIVIYIWYGRTEKNYATVLFQNGKVYSKVQVGL